MPPPIIETEKISKLYQLGSIGAGTLRESLEEWLRALRGKGDKEAPLPPDSNNQRQGPRPNTFWALKDISFSIQAGETVGILGRNGAGKSTLLKLLSRITEPTSGRAVIRGRLASLLEVGTGFHPELSGRENIYLNGTILGMQRSEIHAKLDQIVEFSEIGAYLDTPVKRYSSGMTVRLAFAVAAHLDPDILIVDEVLAVGDLAFQSKCIEKMKTLTNSGMTVLFVSHNMYLLQTLCTRGITLSQGRVIQDGEIHQAVNAYKESLQDSSNSGISTTSSVKDSEFVHLKRLTFNDSEERLITSNGIFDLHAKWEFEVLKPVDLYFGFAITSSEGIYVTGLSTQLEGLGSYHYEPGIHHGGVSLPQLDLASGQYQITISFMDENGVPTYLSCHHVALISMERQFNFDGVLSLQHQWIGPS